MPEYLIAGVTLDLHLSPSPWADSSIRPDAQVGHFLHAGLSMLDMEKLPLSTTLNYTTL